MDGGLTLLSSHQETQLGGASSTLRLPVPEGSPLTLLLKGGGVGGASQETKEPGHPVARLSV